jgi:hypothetical protein
MGTQSRPVDVADRKVKPLGLATRGRIGHDGVGAVGVPRSSGSCRAGQLAAEAG